jgi:hypothetical protein
VQYEALREAVDARMRAVLEHGQFILGPEVGELEKKFARGGDREGAAVRETWRGRRL